MINLNLRHAASNSTRLARYITSCGRQKQLLRAAASNSNASGLAPPSVPELARMAQIGVTDKEVSDWQPKINSIVEWFGQLQQVDVTNVPPLLHATERGSALRADEVQAYPARPELLAQAPQVENTYVRVPKLGGAGGSEVKVATAAATGVPAAGAAPAAAAPAAPAAAAEVNLDALLAMDIRVGKIVSCEKHPEADSLYLEKIDVGEAEPRTIVSGLVKYVPLEEMQGRMVLVICNLKPRNMRGIKSHGMVLAASDAAHEVVEPLAPPAGAAVGERVWFGDKKEQPAPAVPNAVEKKKLWEVVQPALKTGDDRVASYAGMSMMTGAGPVTSATLTGARIA